LINIEIIFAYKFTLNQMTTAAINIVLLLFCRYI